MALTLRALSASGATTKGARLTSQELDQNFLDTGFFTASGIATTISSTVAEKLQNGLSVDIKSDFGAEGDNSTDDTTPIQNALTNLPSGAWLHIPRGTFKTTTGLTRTLPIRITGEGAASIIRGTNAAGAHTLHIDGASTVNGLNGVILRDFVVTSEASGGDALKLSNCASGIVDNVMIPSAAGAGIRSIGSFYMTYVAPKVTTNFPYTVGTRAVPTFGISLEDNATTGIASGHNTIIMPDFAGITTSTGCGINIADNASHNGFYGGKSAGNKLGIVIAAACKLNLVHETVVENNTTRDIDVSGEMNGLIGVQSLSDAPEGITTFYSGAKGNYIVGGRYRLIQVNSGALGTNIFGCGSLTAGVTNNGTGTQQRAVWDITNEVYLIDSIRENTGTWTPVVGGSATYTTQHGRWKKVGTMVFLECHFTINSIGTGSTTVLSGLPFTSSANIVGGAMPCYYFVTLASGADTVSCVGTVIANSSTMQFVATTIAGGALSLPTTIFQNSAQVRFSGWYEAAS